MNERKQQKWLEGVSLISEIKGGGRTMKLKKVGAFGLAVLLALNTALLAEPFADALRADSDTVYAADNETVLQFSDLSMTADFGAKTDTTPVSGDFEITYTGHEVGGSFANAPLVEFRDVNNNCIDFRFDNWGWTFTNESGVVDFTDEQKKITLWPAGDWSGIESERQSGMDFSAKVVREGSVFKATFTESNESGPYVTWTYTVDFPAMAEDATVMLSGGGTVDITNISLSVKQKEQGNPETPDLVIGDYTGTDYAAATPGHVTVHDPSIVYDEKSSMYYIFGSHMAWAKSSDMIHWQTFTNNINRDYASIFAPDAEWSQRGTSGTYDVSTNLWAPDVIWNPDYEYTDASGNQKKGKWCMYMSVNGDHWYTSVVLLTADSLDGDWTRVGPVVYSGFTNSTEAAATDYAKVIGSNDVAPRYLENRNNNRTYGMNAIDPCVVYDDDGNLWMAYGSWFGGIYMLKLDNANGLRDYQEVYAETRNVSDPYQGIKLAGGEHVSGEAPYIQKVGNYYYLYVTYGGLTAKGGYNMRVFRSTDIKGPYVDVSGDDARYTSAVNNINGSVGNRVMSGYKWSYMDTGFVAQGHNSAFVDADGRSYVIYHTRFNDGTEGHQVRVHQTFINEDGWLVTAPFEYTGEQLLKGFDASDVAGSYEVLFHKLNINYGGLEVFTGETLTFGADGTISGARTGTWSFGSKGAPYVTMTIGGNTYKGVFLRQQMEDSREFTWVFTVLGSDEVSVWGYRYPGDDAQQAVNAAENLVMPEGTFTNLELPSQGLFNSSITWKSSNEAVLASDGTVTQQNEDTLVTMTATFKVNDAEVNKDFQIKVYSSPVNGENKVLASYFTGEKVDLTSAAKGTYQFANPFYEETTKGLAMYNGVSVSFDLEAAQGADQWLSDIISFNAGEKGGLFFEGNSYLGYNGTGGIFDANLKNGSFTGQSWQWGKNFIGNGAHVEIQILPTGFAVYVNGELAYDQDSIEPYESGKTDYTVPGEKFASSYADVLDYLRNTAKYLNFGWGSFWDGGYKGTISNVVLSAMPIEVVDTSNYLYYEDYTKLAGKRGDATGWISTNASDKLSVILSQDAHSYYLSYADPNANGSRGAYLTFPEAAKISRDFTVETDVILNSGNDRDTVFAIANKNKAYDGNNINSGISSGFFIRLTVAKNSTDCTAELGSGETCQFTLPKDTWIHVKVYVDDKGNIAATVGDQVLNGTLTDTAVLDGMYLLNGRKKSYSAVDTITVREHNWDAETVIENAAAVSCTTDGSYDEVLYCPACGEELSRNTVTTEALGHSYDSGVITAEPTCAEAGVTTYTCQRTGCGAVKTETVPAKGHTAAPAVKEKEVSATCEKDGSYDEAVYCSVCREEISRKTLTVTASGHKYGEPVYTWNADNSVTAFFTCSVCRDEKDVAAVVSMDVTGGITAYRAAVTFEGKTYTAMKQVITLEDNRDMRIVVDDAVKELPKALIDIGLDTETKIIDKMMQTLKEKSVTDKNIAGKVFSVQNSAFFEVTLQIVTQDNKWEDVTPQNFPKEGVNILVPYPEGTNAKDYDFVVSHMFTVDMNGRKPGEVEILDAVKTENGLKCKVSSLSPIMVSWVPAAKAEGDNGTETTAPNTAPNTGSGVSNESPNTADSSLPLWMMLCGIIGCGLLSVACRRSRNVR